MKLFLITISILFLAINVSAQEKCELALEQAPMLQNLRLGMLPQEVTSALKLKLKVKTKGQKSFFKSYAKKKAKRNLAGIRAIFLRFYDGKLYQIEFFYEKDYRWQNLESLLDYYSTQNNFPKEFWQNEYGYASADCKGFSLDADYILNPHIQLTNDAIAELVEKERAEKEKKNTK